MADPEGAQNPAARAVAWLGAAIFAASLAYFLFTYVVTFREITQGPLRWRDVGTNVALFSVFALHHSVFARFPVRAWMARRVSPQLERSVYVWIASLMLIVVCALWRPIPGVAWAVTGPAVWLLRLSLAAGVWLTLRSAAIIDVWELAGIRAPKLEGLRPPRRTRDRTPRPVPSDTIPVEEGLRTPEPVFRTEGPYGWVRHPIYSGWFLVVFTVTPMTATRLLFAIVSCAYILVAIPFEERTLRETSGGAYGRYVQRVRWKLLPGVF